jgi:hypothetical protein
MNQQSELDKFFRDHQYLTEEMPAQQAWKQLERRLDIAAARRLRTLWVKRMAVAAGISAIIVFTGLSGILHGRGTGSDGFQLEVVGNTADYPQAVMAMALQKDFTAQAQGIREGEPGKKFR